MNKHELYDDIHRIMMLEDNWDDEGGLKPTEPIILNTINFLNYLCREHSHIINPEVNPVGNETIDLEFHHPTNNHYLLINFKEDSYSFYGCRDSKIRPIDDEINGTLATGAMNNELYIWIKNNL